MTRPTRAILRSSALRTNLRVAREHANGARVMAVVKANAYGHGLLRVATALSDVDAFALLELDAAARLREAGFAHPLLMLEGYFDPQELPVISRLSAATVVHHTEQVRMLEAVTLGAPIDVHLKINTGMNRLGVAPDSAKPLVQRLRACANVRTVSLMTHFACAEGERGIGWQLERFDAATAGMRLPCSLANSAALLRYRESARDWVRPGIMLYGISPFAEMSATQLGLEPVMTLTSEVIAVRDLQRGDSVGYGCSFTADIALRIGIVACGYADGYPRHAASGSPVVVAGQRTRVLGRPSMDMLAVDLTSIPGARVGSPVTLWGESLPAEEVAAAAQTIAYELLCALALRVPVVEVE